MSKDLLTLLLRSRGFLLIKATKSRRGGWSGTMSPTISGGRYDFTVFPAVYSGDFFFNFSYSGRRWQEYVTAEKLAGLSAE